MQKIKLTSFLMLILGLNISLSAQFITNASEKYGLVSESGNVLLPNIYDEIIPFKASPLAFQYRLGNKWGIYSCYSGTNTTPVYDKIQGKDEYYTVYQNNKTGILKFRTKKDKDTLAIGPVIYDEVTLISNYHWGVRIDSLYGSVPQWYRDSMPVEFRHPLNYHFSAGFYEKLPGGKTVLILGRDENGQWIRFCFPDDKFKTDDDFLFYDNKEAQTFTVIDLKKKKKTLEVPYTDTYYRAKYEDIFHCVEVHDTIPGATGKSKYQTRITCYNPNDGSLLFTVDTPPVHKIYLEDVWFAERHKDQSYPVYAASWWKTTGRVRRIYIGTLTGYTFNPLPAPRTISVDSGTRSHSGKKPFFMPGN